MGTTTLKVIVPWWLLLWFIGIMTLDCFPPLDNFMAPSGIMKTSLHGRGIKITSSSRASEPCV